jgi:hypothetical protein
MDDIGWVKRVRMLATGALGAAVVLTAATMPAAAQQDPYGSTSTTRPPTAAEPNCSFKPSSAEVGATADARVSQVPRGKEVRLYFAGELVASEVADPNGNANYVTVAMSFTVPDREPGNYSIEAVIDTFTAPCSSGSQTTMQVSAAGEGNGQGQGNSSRASFLRPESGAELALWVVATLALVLAARAVILEFVRRREVERAQARARSRRRERSRA